VTRNWRTTVRNNKNQPITITILDQIPVSINREIEVFHDQLSNGRLNSETGEVRWQFRLSPGERQELDLLYRVRHPRGRNVIVE
jgi:hypothetical protein